MAAATTGDPIVGDWTVTYGAPAVVTMTLSKGVYTVKAKTPVRVTGSSCYLPVGTVIATFSSTGANSYSGQHGLWYTSNCSFGEWDGFTLTLSSDHNTLTGVLAGGYGTVVYTRLAVPTLQLTVVNGNQADLVSGNSWQPNEHVDVYLDTAEGAELVGSFAADSSGSFTNEPLVDFSGSISMPGDQFSQENFPIVAMGDNSNATVDAAAIDSFTQSSQDGAVINSSDGTNDGGCFAYGSNITPSPTPAVTPSITAGSGLTTSGSTIEYAGNQVTLDSVNWYGAEEADFVPGGLQCQSVATIAASIKAMGFNSVRLPWSNAMEEENPSICGSTPTYPPTPCIPPQVLAANTSLATPGNTAINIYKTVVKTLTADKLMVILDNHGTDAAFEPVKLSSNGPNLDGIWWGGQYWDNLAGGFGAEARVRTGWWVRDWAYMANLFKTNQYVVGADLRNEPSATPYACPTSPCSPAWGSGGAKADWHAAAERAGNKLLTINPHLLIVVEGLNYSGTIPKPLDPVVLNPAGQVVYSVHEYPTCLPPKCTQTNDQLYQDFSNNWGYLVSGGSAPVWVGEFGATVATVSAPTCLGSVQINDENTWLSCFLDYDLQTGGDNWSWWGVNGTDSDSGIFHTQRAFYSLETYGIFDPSWNLEASTSLMNELYCAEQTTCNGI